jgi:uncharacterized protein (UPF0335 family)
MTLHASSQDQLRQYILQIEVLEAEKADIAEAVREKFLEAKANGFDPKIMKQVLKLRQKPKADREEEQAVLDTYCHALGMLASGDDTPMGERWRDDDSVSEVHV